MAEIKRDDYPALYENGKGEFTVVPDWRSGPVGFFRSKRSLEEFEAEQAAEMAAAVAANEADRIEREARAREEGEAVRAAIQAREAAAQAALARRKAEQEQSQAPSPLASAEPAESKPEDAAVAGTEDPAANALASWANG